MRDLALAPPLYHNARKPRDAGVAKCLFAQRVLPGRGDAAAAAGDAGGGGGETSKRSPKLELLAAALTKAACCHTVEVLLPGSMAPRLRDAWKGLEGETMLQREFARVTMRLGEILEGDFFNGYVKTGTILMRTSPSPSSTTTTILLTHGTLHLSLDRETYQRSGLHTGTPDPHGPGRKHQKQRYSLALDLRAPAMLPGRPGFERLRAACREVFPEPRMWLFCEEAGAAADVPPSSPPIAPFNPHRQPLHPLETLRPATRVPAFPSHIPPSDPADASDLLEWLTLALHGSPRVQLRDPIDPLLSRYQVPDFDDGRAAAAAAAADAEGQDLVCFRWHGFLSTSRLAHRVLHAAVEAACAGAEWCAVRVQGFDRETGVGLVHAGRSFVWNFPA